MTITLTREEAQQVLDALVFSTPSGAGPAEVYKDAVVLLQDRLEQPDSKAHLQFSGLMHVVCKCDKCKAQPEPEPVAWRFYYKNMWSYVDNISDLSRHKFEPLYTAPPQREWKGLTRGDSDLLRVIYTKNGIVQINALLMRVDEMLREKNS